jgi:flagellar motor protein MotB
MKPQLSAVVPTLKRHRVTQRKTKKHMSLGNWKLVYADFVTVLMAFFIVVWILLFDRISERDKLDTSCLQPLATELQRQLSSDMQGTQAQSFMQVEYSVEGLRLTLLDTQKPMFQTGRAEMSDFARDKFSKIASVVNLCPNHQLKIEGYTDSTGYAAGATGYGNWELSTERANSARRELLAQKVAPQRIAQVIGYGDSKPSIPADPSNPLNRRISITVLPPLKETAQAVSTGAAQGNLNQPLGANSR